MITQIWPHAASAIVTQVCCMHDPDIGMHHVSMLYSAGTACCRVDNVAFAEGQVSAAPTVLQVREQLDPQIKAAKPRWIGDITLTE